MKNSTRFGEKDFESRRAAGLAVLITEDKDVRCALCWMRRMKVVKVESEKGGSVKRSDWPKAAVVASRLTQSQVKKKVRCWPFLER